MSRSTHFPDLPAPTCRWAAWSDTRHGITRTDEYHWLRAANWQAVLQDPSLLDPEVRRHLQDENAYQDRLMAGTEALQALLVAEMKGRIREDDASVPMRDGPYAYGTSFVAGGQHPRFVRVPVSERAAGGRSWRSRA